MEQSIYSKAQSAEQTARKRTGLAFKRDFTRDGTPPLDRVAWTRRRSVISEPGGKIVFELGDCEVPEAWSQLATDIVVSKYFRKAGSPSAGHEVSVRQVIRRIAHTIRVYGQEQGYFQTNVDADIFEETIVPLLRHVLRSSARIHRYPSAKSKPAKPQFTPLDLEAMRIRGGWFGRVFGQGDDARTHWYGFLCFILILARVLAYFFDDSGHYTPGLLASLREALMLAVGYFVGKR
jgi:hypothetical protein